MIKGTGSKKAIALSVGLLALLLAVLSVAVMTPAPVAAVPGSCSEQVSNGSFETGETPWIYVVSSTPTPGTFRTTFTQHSGQYAALLGGRDNTNERLSQVVVLPPAATSDSLMFSFWWTRYTEETPGPGRDFMYVELYSADGNNLLAQLLTFDNNSGIGDLDWNPIALSIQQYAGQTVQLTFRVTTDINLLTRFFVDDVSIQAGTTCPTPMATITLTFTPSVTPTSTATPTRTLTPTSTATPKARTYLPLIVQGTG